MTENLSFYSDDELSLRVFNDEQLYVERHMHGFIDTLAGLFTFTNEQRAVLADDLINDLSEMGVEE